MKPIFRMKEELKMRDSNQNIITYLTFSGNAEEAMNFYVSIFPDSKILELTRIGENDRGEKGKVLNGTFNLRDQLFMAMDMEKSYAPSFTWAISLCVLYKDEKEFDTTFEKLSSDGNVLMGPEPIYNLKKVAWVTDKFDVTWQLVLE